MGLYHDLKEYGESGFYPFHMPGHKRNLQSGCLSGLYQIDLTEIDGFDNLHCPESIIMNAQERAAQLYHSEETYYLINGSTSGILSAVSAVACGGDTLLIARNCHKAVYHAAFLNHMDLAYVYPEICEKYDIAGEITARQIKERLDAINPMRKVAGVVVTSPTYDGICSNIREIGDLVHQYGIPLIVDQAHGAHFGLHPLFPENAVCQGADLVIHSVHKTLAAPTQTALIHKNGLLVDSEKLRSYLGIYQSSSPSYPLMAGIDEAIRIAEDEGKERLSLLLDYRKELISHVAGCKYIRICPDTEPGKLVISVKGTSMTGQQLYDVLRRKYHLQMEMASGTYVLAILSMMDTKEGLKRLSKALCEIDKELYSLEIEKFLLVHSKKVPEKRLELWDSFLKTYEEEDLDCALGRIAAEFVNLYPPGIPLLVPGEVISAQFVDMIKEYQKKGYTVQGVNDKKVKVVV